MYEPKKKKYNDLKSLHKEMLDAGQKVTIFDGVKIVTKDGIFTLYDGQIFVRPSK